MVTLSCQRIDAWRHEPGARDRRNLHRRSCEHPSGLAALTLVRSLIAVVCVAFLLADTAQARRVALVIGNSSYSHASMLPNTGNDAVAVAEALRRLAFDHVELQRDLGADALRRALLEFERHATGADIALVYFAGHGIEVDGVNYLIPTDARLARANGAELEAVSLATVTSMISGARKLRLVILDSCRNNPFVQRMAADGAGRKRSIGRGLARVEPGENELIAFAAAAGTEADDGTGRHSPFTAALLKHIERPGLEVQQLFRNIRDEVLSATKRSQVPHTYGTLGAEQIFLKVAAAAESAALATPGSSPAAIPRGFRLMPQVGHTNSVTSLAVSPDGRWFASGSRDKTVRVWEASTGRLVRTLGSQAEVIGIAITPDGRHIVGAGDTTVSVWVAATGQLVRTVNADPCTVSSVVVLPDRSIVGGCSNIWSVTIWDEAAGRQELEAHGGVVTSLGVSADGKWLVSGSADKTVKVWEVATRRVVRTIKGHTDWVNAVAFSPDGQWIVSGSNDKTVRVWEAATGRLVRTLEGHAGQVQAVALSLDGRWIVSGTDDGGVTVWDARTGKVHRALKGGGPSFFSFSVSAVAVSPDARWIVSGGDGGAIRVWETATGSLARTLPGHSDDVRAVASSADGRWVASGSNHASVRLWDAATGRLVFTLDGHTEWVNSVAFSPDGRWLASGSWDHTIKVWETAGGRLVRTLDGHTGWVNSVAFSPSGEWIVSGGSDNAIRIWEAPTGRLSQTFKAPTAVGRVVVTADGRSVVSIDANAYEVKRWELATGHSQSLEPGDRALVVTGANPRIAVAGSIIRLGTPTGAMFTTLPDGHWAAIGADGLAHTGTPQGVEGHLHLAEIEGFATRHLDEAFRRSYFRPEGLGVGQR